MCGALLCFLAAGVGVKVKPCHHLKNTSGGFGGDARIEIAMSNRDRSFLYHLLRHRTSVFLELGSGGSTVLASTLAPRFIRQIVSVDTSREWLARVRSLVSTHPATQRHHHHDDQKNRSSVLDLRLADVGPTSAWGWPARWETLGEDERVRIGTRYVDALAHISDIACKSCFSEVDTILVDSRFRRSAVLVMLPLLAPGGTLLLHDCDRYTAFLKRFFSFCAVDQLCVLDPLPNLTLEGALENAYSRPVLSQAT